MIAGLVRQALRKHPWTFVGPACTQALAATIVTASLGLRASMSAANVSSPENGLDVVAPLFVMISVYLSLIIVGVTMGSAISRQARDIALARTIGAGPGQVRRAIALQAAVVALPSTAAGYLLGGLVGRLWVDGLVTNGVAPESVTFHGQPAALPIALAVTLPTSLLGAMIAAIRLSRIRPAAAMSDTAAPRRGAGIVRTIAGLLFAAGGVFAASRVATLDAEEAGAAAFIIMLAMCAAAGLLGPILLRAGAPLARVFGRTGAIAAGTMAVRARSLSGALVPLALATSFAAVKVAMHTTVAHVTGVDEARDVLWLDYSGTAVYTAFATVAALATLVTVTMSRRREFATVRLAGATRAHALRIVACEAIVVIVTSLVVAAAAAATLLVPLLHASLGVAMPHLPAGAVISGVFGVVAVVGLGTVLPAAFLLRRPPLEAVSVDA
ncbi:FtsX-like permease family protein [Actinoplanes sp. NPDC024001]|uniref:FtsX-like permease family protein n=1 Tax=Actinoplanes sp. NPDC024001 TaxID=3154598 RepID=UPI0033E8E7D8